MKAKEILAAAKAKIDDGVDERQVAFYIIKTLSSEGIERLKMRCKGEYPSNAAAQAVLRETEAQWRVIARGLDWNTEGWRIFWASKDITF